jgi:hypothetical protein
MMRGETMPSLVEKRKTGMFLGPVAPYGYLIDPDNAHHLIINEETAKTVRDIFKWYAVDKMFLADITRKLNDLEIPSPAALKKLKVRVSPEKNSSRIALWSHTTVRSILKNQMYLGHMVQGCRSRTNDDKVKSRINSEDEWTIVQNTHAPIVEQEIYDMAKKRLECNRYYAKENRDDNEFAGLLRCPDCGYAMTRIGGSNTRLIGFQCSTYRSKSKKVCARHGVRIEVLREAVLDAIKTQVKMARSLYDIIDEICASPKILNENKRLSSEMYKRQKESENFRLIF